MSSTLDFLSGKKTYLIALGVSVYALAGFLLGQMDSQEAIRLFMEAGIGSSLRAGVAKSGPAA